MASLSVQELEVKYGDVAAVKRVSLDVQEGEFVTLLGPSGCGKTTTLRAIAGLEPCAGGQIRIGGQLVGGSGVHVPPEKRRINMVFQTYAVWPHMSVYDNVAFGLKIRRLPKSEIKAKVRAALELVGLETLSKRFATELSGGQQQRVALARAIVTEPRLILFDEPLSNLDATLREQMRSELRELHNRIGKTAIYVTHDQSEAMVMSDRIVLMNGGRIDQVGTPRELYECPQTRFAAGFLGVSNLWPAVIAEEHGSNSARIAEFTEAATPRRVTIEGVGNLRSGTRGAVAVRAERVEISREEPEASGLNVWIGTVETAEYLGGRIESRIRLSEDFTLRAETRPSLDLAVGDQVFVAINPKAFIWIADGDLDNSTDGASTNSSCAAAPISAG